MPQFYVYVYRDPSRRNEPIYVGKGQDDRAHSHLTRKDMHPFTHRLQLMKRNGIEPITSVVNLPSEALAIQCEIDTIARFGRKDLGLGPVLNMTDGGEGASGRVEGAETRKKKSDAMKGENHHNFGKPAYNKGKSPSAESRQKNSDAHKGKSTSPEARKKQAEAMKGKVQPKSVCPHCGKLSGPSRWHFDNCKHKKVS